MKYCISDIHGQADLFSELLDEIKPTIDDEIYLLGDYVDSGNGFLAVMRRIDEMRKYCKVTALMGNHDYMMYKTLLSKRTRQRVYSTISNPCMLMSTLWNMNRNAGTKRAYRKMAEEDMDFVFSFLENLEFMAKTEANGHKYVLCHAVPLDTAFGNEQAVWGRIYPVNGEVADYTRDMFSLDLLMVKYYGDKVVHGHTNTNNPHIFDVSCQAKIQRYHSFLGNFKTEFIDIDCGAGHLYDSKSRLACLRLDDEREYYAKC